jgi:hypothetical protein
MLLQERPQCKCIGGSVVALAPERRGRDSQALRHSPVLSTVTMHTLLMSSPLMLRLWSSLYESDTDL